MIKKGKIYQKSVYDFKFKDIRGNELPMAQYRGHVLLIVNTASKCGFTPQLKGLEKLNKKYSSRKFLVIGFPCNQFGKQEPGSNTEIESFCISNFETTFLLAGKIDVNGPNAHPLFRYLKSKAPDFLGSEKIKWNFTKFLIDRNGQVLKRFAPYVPPSKISSYIEDII